MPVLVLLCVVAVIWLIFSGRLNARPQGGGQVFSARKCRWSEARFRANKTSKRWVCSACNTEAFSYDGKPPKECKRHLRNTSL